MTGRRLCCEPYPRPRRQAFAGVRFDRRGSGYPAVMIVTSWGNGAELPVTGGSPETLSLDEVVAVGVNVTVTAQDPAAFGRKPTGIV